MAELFPDAWYLILSSRLVPDLDGGYTISTLARARQMADAGAPPLLLTVDPGTADAHAAHRAEFVARGAAAASEVFRNLFDEAVGADGGAAEWMRAAARPGGPDPTLEYRSVAGGAVDLPNVVDPHWHLSSAPIVVRDAKGVAAGVVGGFGALYRAWLAHVVAELRERVDRPVVLICESRQLGELLVEWDDPGVRILHTVHTIHLEPPFTADAPVNALWERWLSVASRFDAVLWPTASQRDDVRARFGDDRIDVVAPHGVPVPSGGWGAGAEHGRRAALVRDLGLEGLVTLPGLTLDPGAVLDSASVYLTTSAFEGQGLALAEALAHAVPVVAYDIRYGPRDMLAMGGGILVPDGDEGALVEALAGLLGDTALRQRLSAEARAAAAALSPARAMQTVAAACVDALSRPARR